MRLKPVKRGTPWIPSSRRTAGYLFNARFWCPELIATLTFETIGRILSDKSARQVKDLYCKHGLLGRERENLRATAKLTRARRVVRKKRRCKNPGGTILCKVF